MSKWSYTVQFGESRTIRMIVADGPTQIAVLTEGTDDDARLIAAAPELLAALEEALATGLKTTIATIERLASVAAKAKGTA